MVYIERATGRCRVAQRPPDSGWELVPGQGALFRRRRADGWHGAHAFEPDTPLWVVKGWERVRFRPAEPGGEPVRGRRSRLRIALAPPSPGEIRDGQWVLLVDEPGLDTPAERPGAQGLFRRDTLRDGAPTAGLAADLLAARIVARGLPLERALWVLRGPPVSPEDASINRKMQSIIALAERLSSDLTELVDQPESESSSAQSVSRPAPPPARPAPR